MDKTKYILGSFLLDGRFMPSKKNLDIMYIKKNVFDNIFNMIMDVKWKIKYNMKAIIDLAFYYNCKNIELLNDDLCAVKLKAIFSFDNDA